MIELDKCSLSMAEIAGKYHAEMELLVETEVECPHCGESFPLQVDTSQGTHRLIEDCSVCCRPINLLVRCRPGSITDICEED